MKTFRALLCSFSLAMGVGAVADPSPQRVAWLACAALSTVAFLVLSKFDVDPELVAALDDFERFDAQARALVVLVARRSAKVRANVARNVVEIVGVGRARVPGSTVAQLAAEGFLLRLGSESVELDDRRRIFGARKAVVEYYAPAKKARDVVEELDRLGDFNRADALEIF